MGNVVVTGSQAGTGLAIRKQLEASGRIVLGIDLPGN
jgi:NAD(P)-dependent dehydrogenase (short-subunit alcohol dehydrogenase family)